MKWIEIITLRSLRNMDTQFVNELLKEVGNFNTASHPIEIKIYHHRIVETDLSIHIYWETEPGSQHKSPLGLRFFYGLKNLGLLNHSVWVETAALEFVPRSYGNFQTGDIPGPNRKDDMVQTGPKIADKERF